MHITWRALLLVAAVVLFVIAGLISLTTITGPAPLALDSFGLACVAASFLPIGP